MATNNKNVIAYLIDMEDRVSKKLEDVQKEADKSRKAFDKLRKKQEEQRQASERQAKALASLRTGFKAAAAAAAVLGAGFAAFGKSAIDATADMETYQAQLEVLLGSADAARERLEKLFEIGSSTPFELDQIVAAEQRLVSFGANADEMRGGVMDLVGALGGDLPSAALAVGKSFAAGRGASDGLRESYALLFQDVTRRAEALGGSDDINNWRNSIIAALNDVNGVVAGGTAKLAATFKGQLSNVSDQWFKFKKQVGDAGLFDYAKLGIKELIDGLNTGNKRGQQLAEMLSMSLIDALDATVRVFGVLATTVTGFAVAIKAVAWEFETFIYNIRAANVALYEMFPLLESVSLIPGIDLGPGLEESRKALDRSAESLREYKQEMDVLTGTFMRFGRVGETMDEVREKFQQMQQMVTGFDFDFGEGPLMPEFRGATEGQGTVLADQPVPVVVTGGGGGGGAGGGKSAEKSEAEKLSDQFMKDLARSTEKARDSVERLTDKQLSESERLKKEIDKLTDSMVKTANKAAALGIDLGGPEMTARFDAFQAEIEATADAYEAALKKEAEAGLKAAEAALRAASAMDEQAKQTVTMSTIVGNAMGELSAAMQTGGLSLLSALPDKTKKDPVTGETTGVNFAALGGGAASLIGFGMQGDQAYEQEVATKAEQAAKDRQDAMKTRRKAMQDEGFSEAEIEAAGLGKEAIAEAGEVTDEDEEAAKEDTDRGEVMADMVTGMVEGIIEGLKALLQGLPEILKELIPMLLIDLPTALIDMIPAFIEELIPVLITDLPAALVKMVFKLIPKIMVMLVKVLFQAIPKAIAKWWHTVTAWLADLFSFGFQTGGYVPKTQQYLLHQGERVIPASGASTGTAAKGLGAFTGGMGGGPSVVVNTNVVDPDSLLGLSRLINQEMGALGRATVPIWGEAAPMTSL